MRFRLTNRSLSPIRQRATQPGWLRNENGTAAIEFAIVAMPFLSFVLGILGMGLYFFATTSLEYGVEAASRTVRTGEVRTAGASNKAMTVAEFRKAVCDAAGPYIDCSKLSVILQHATSWSGISPQACVDSKGNMAGSTGATGEPITNYSGGASEVVLVTLCYQWDLANAFSLLKLGSSADGSGAGIIQAATAFKSEPYDAPG
jgi:Flp pilus assembly protein TadG